MEGYTPVVRELRQEQVQILEQQDQGLEELSRIIGRQRQLAQAIGNEVEGQNELIDDITDRTDQTRSRLLRQTDHINIVSRKDSTWCYWIIIMLLLVAIVVVASIPKQKS